MFEGGFPTPETIQRAYDEADLNRAVQTFRFFYPSVSMMAIWKGNLAGGVAPNQVFAVLEGTPRQLVFTPNSDTPYSGLLVDLSAGPMVVELPPGLLMGTANDLNQRWVLDLGLPGPDKGKGGKHLLFPPGWDGQVPEGYYAATATTNRVLVMVRAMPQGGDMAAATELMKSVKVYPLEASADWTEPTWVSLTEQAGLDFTPVRWEDNLTYWQVLAELIDTEPAYAAYRHAYGELAELGIVKGQPFAPTSACKKSSPRRPASAMPSCASCPSPTADPSVVSGREPSGSGRCRGPRTAPSTPRPMWTCTPGRSGSTRPRSSRRRCSPAPQGPGRCTGWACATTPAPISMAPTPTP